MATNDFSKEERVAFEDILEGFNDALVISAQVMKYDIGDVMAERALDTVWRPVPYIVESYDGMDQTGNFNDKTQLSVPSSLTTQKSVPFKLDARELRDGLQEDRLVKAAYQRLGSDVNSALLRTASFRGTAVATFAGKATGYDEVAELDSIFNETGVPMMDRCLCLNTRDYNSMAGNLAERQTMNDKPTKAYEKAYVGEVAQFDTFKMDVAQNVQASDVTGATVTAADQRHIPRAVDLTQDGQRNVDNRSMLLAVAVGAGAFKEGDAFTVDGVYSVHNITKEDCPSLKTFRVIGTPAPGFIEISPAIVAIDHAGFSIAEVQYQNVSATPAAGAAITMLNTVTAKANPFWHKNAIELLPGRLVMPSNSGLAVMRGTTDQGLDVLFTRQGDINSLTAKYRLDTFFGTVNTLPEHSGIMLFGQT